MNEQTAAREVRCEERVRLREGGQLKHACAVPASQGLRIRRDVSGLQAASAFYVSTCKLLFAASFIASSLISPLEL